MIRLAVIGCGHWGPNLIRNFQQSGRASVQFVCDKDEERLGHIRKIYPGQRTCLDYREILGSPEVEAVYIATPTSSHFAIAKEALLAGKHVLVEKPMTLSSRDAGELISLANHQHRILMVGHTFEYNEAVRRLKEIIQQGELGKILYVSMTRVNLGIFRDDVNVVWDLCPHDISILNYLFAKNPLTVAAQGASHFREGVEDTAFAVLRYPEDLLVHIHASWLDPRKVRTIVVVGDKKMAVYDDLDDRAPLQIYDKRVTKQPYYETFGEFKLLYNWGDVLAPKIVGVEPLRVECAHFLDCVEHGQKPQSDGESGRKVVRILEAIQQSLKEGGRVVDFIP